MKYHLKIQEVHWDCGDGCCSDSWKDLTVYVIDENDKVTNVLELEEIRIYDEKEVIERAVEFLSANVDSDCDLIFDEIEVCEPIYPEDDC